MLQNSEGSRSLPEKVREWRSLAFPPHYTTERKMILIEPRVLDKYKRSKTRAFLQQNRCRCNMPKYTPGRFISGVKAAKAYIMAKVNIHVYPWVYYGLGQFIPPQAKLYPNDINNDINIV